MPLWAGNSRRVTAMGLVAIILGVALVSACDGLGPDCEANCGRGNTAEKGPGWGQGDGRVDCICTRPDGSQFTKQFDGGS